LPPVAVGEAPKPSEPVDPNDPALRMIKDALNIKTTILDKAAPPPVILADAKRDADPVPAPPIPMAGPPPRLDSPEPRFADRPPMIPNTPAARPVPLLNNRAVELDFEVTRAGLSKVRAVELWTTRDGGTTWKQTDRMEGSRPPFRTRLGSEGEYGFRLVFESESGMRTPEPKPGQSPELVLELDTTPPRVAIGVPRPVVGEPGKVILTWSAADAHLDRDPSATSPEYSTDGQTWQPIERQATGLGPYGGSCEWTLPPGAPSRVLLRVTVRDKAGNVGSAVTSDKVSVDLVPPEGKVTGVRVQGQGPEPGPMPHEVRAAAPTVGVAPRVLRAVLAALLNSPEFEPTPSLPALSDLPNPKLTVQEMHEQWCRNQEEMLRTLVRAESAKAWVEQVTNTAVAEDPPILSFSRYDPFAAQPFRELLPADTERLLAQLHGRVQVYDPAAVDVERDAMPSFWSGPADALIELLERKFKPGAATRLVQERRQAAEVIFGVLTRGETVLRLLTDRDWQPSTAKPASYRVDGPTFADRPFGGQFDAVPGFWGTLPGGGVRLDF
jgi:hypothetical protein